MYQQITVDNYKGLVCFVSSRTWKPTFLVMQIVMERCIHEEDA